MKKFLSSFVLIFIFTTYVLYGRQSGLFSVTNDAIAITDSKISVNNIANNLPNSVPKQKSIPKPTPTPIPVKQITKGIYNDGSYTGSVEDAYYGNVQVQAIIQNGKIADVIFLDHPSDRNTSIRINNYAMPRLKSEAISAQSANVNIVSGATDTSMAFKLSLASALASAKI